MDVEEEPIDHSFELQIDEEQTIHEEEKEVQALARVKHRNMSAEVAGVPKRHPNDVDVSEKYYRSTKGNSHVIRETKDKKLRGDLKKKQQKYKEAAISAAKAEILLPGKAGFIEAEGMEKTFKITQETLAKNLDMNTSSKIFDLKLLDYGKYIVNYSPNGRNLLLGSSKGHVAILDTLRMKLSSEFHVNEHVKDLTFLHNVSMFAVAQKKYVYIYDDTGAEVHCLRDYRQPNQIQFLPYHFLLAGIGNQGLLRYTDTSTGKLVVEHRTKLGTCNTMTQNSWNAVIHCGHGNGVVTLWTPNMTSAVVKMQCHQGPLQSLAIDRSGCYMATAGMDRRVKIWDLRTYQELHSYSTTCPATSLDISQRGLLAVAFGGQVQIWKDSFVNKARSPYMSHRKLGDIMSKVKFQPYEDVLSIGHSSGLSNIVIPGAGEPNFDTYETNPFEDVKQRREAEVHSLLDKLQPEMITLDPTVIGQIDRNPIELHQEKTNLQFEANHSGQKKEKKKARGRNKISKKLQRKRKNVVTEETMKLRKKLDDQKTEAKRTREKQSSQSDGVPRALSRFFKKQRQA